MKTTFSILVPTKKRPNNIVSLMKSLEENTSELCLEQRQLEVIFYIDMDDDISLETIDQLRNKTAIQVGIAYSQLPVKFSDMWNKAYQQCTGDYVMLCGDDVEFKTKNWDVKVLKAFYHFPDEICYITVKDGYQNGALGVHGFVSRKWVELTGFFTPPYFDYWYADTWIDEVSKSIGRYVYLDNVEVIHYHPATSNSRGTDDVYQINDSKITPELIALYESKKEEREKQASILKKYIEEFNTKSDQVYDIRLSILICSILDRKNKFDKLILEIKRQIKELGVNNEVEVLYEIDDAVQPTGKKRNTLIQRSKGEYVVFIDDDDTIHPNYLEHILIALKENPDTVGFCGKIFWKGEYYKFHNSIKHKEWSCVYDTKLMFDSVSHINPIKSSIAKKYRFPEKFWGEDKGWLDNVRLELATEYFIPTQLYFYNPSLEDDKKRNKDLGTN